MTIDEYFAQDRYFSESAQEFRDISEMAFPHAYNAHMKLAQEFGQEYLSTCLAKKFQAFLCPPAVSIRESLNRYGRVGVAPTSGHRNTRSRIYSAARALGVKVKTHWNGKWVEAEVVGSPFKVSLKGKTYA